MRIAIADPPYPGQAKKHYGDHPDYAGEVDHRELLKRLDAEYDGWALHTASTTLAEVLGYATALGLDYRIGAWVKPFAAFKANIPVAYAWEPALFHPARPAEINGWMVSRDWVSAPITMQRGLAGVKPEKVCHWVFEVLGAQPDDELADLYPGTGAVAEAWITWRTIRALPAVVS